ncbi:tRNA (adenosine(37)-N6)-threonylcarbamoyltransferase complex ATPase subunit type 1 TsaE [Antarcticibacterium flavum]|uniref:tRNA threonylcarbamoyladenosine biosynthesis protein TsaE n=1 Tax=Antarcticibacterium flavum TaxID=2058175 RepID=A0A5B7WZ18_9FLAO|nr:MULTISPECIES: tRNA (adenosine(37)-N6)-threonylcarbamoyltransferase complex ATPase subunit type 1 TsaE [Antarcticibacterium]MCM4158986.1 tRNA (adenosine(37)-N6)-threonylcarbamoyltransferase complex ATPase subunit type 1 TsaE [Antarcticibacterium sp. W02-3]QCY68237.1 tRNA (adenosine(37)-N6)-threonylcarbamoyltransferase complex ATPase subunit type 1 TsaE [Antarcticibacterium flavum]
MSLTYELSEIDSIAVQLLSKVKSKTLLFYGNMGAGKTTLIKALVKALGAPDLASSPTFSLVNEYQTAEGRIFHFDFYRIEDEAEALDMGIEDYLNTDSWKLIEWPQKIESLLDDDMQKLEIGVLDNGARKLKFC